MEEVQVTPEFVSPRIRWTLARQTGAVLVFALVASLAWVTSAAGGLSTLRIAYARLVGRTLLVDSTAKSFGVVHRGDPIAVSYKLTNRSGREIRIVGCQAMCRCVVPTDLPMTLRPEESRDFRTSVRNPSQEIAPEAENIHWNFVLFTTDPGQARIALTLTGRIGSQPNAPVSAP